MRADPIFHHPPRRWRVALVAGVLAVPGAIAGAMVGLFVGAFVLCSVAGGVAGAAWGALLESGPPDET